VNMASGNMKVLCGSFSRSTIGLAVPESGRFTRWILGWYLCMEFSTSCKLSRFTVRLVDTANGGGYVRK